MRNISVSQEKNEDLRVIQGEVLVFFKIFLSNLLIYEHFLQSSSVRT
jgi:hypothetical protein